MELFVSNCSNKTLKFILGLQNTPLEEQALFKNDNKGRKDKATFLKHHAQQKLVTAIYLHIKSSYN